MSSETSYVDNYPNRITLSVIRAFSHSRRHIYQELLHAGPEGISKKALSQRLSDYPEKPVISLSNLLYAGSLPYPSFVEASDPTSLHPTLYATELAERFLQPTLPIAEAFHQKYPDAPIASFNRINRVLAHRISLLYAVSQGIPIDISYDKSLAERVQKLCEEGYFIHPHAPQLTREGKVVVSHFLRPIMRTLFDKGVAEVTEESYRSMRGVMKGRRTAVVE